MLCQDGGLHEKLDVYTQWDGNNSIYSLIQVIFQLELRRLQSLPLTISIDFSREGNFVIIHIYNGLSDHDAQLTFWRRNYFFLNFSTPCI